VLSWLRPPSEDHPAVMLRWVRKVDIVMIPVGLLLALQLWSEDVGVWWLALAVPGLALLGLATIGPAIRKAEAHGPNDPATRSARRRRAERLTFALFGLFIAVAVVVALLVEGAGLAIPLGVLLSLTWGFGIWLSRRWADE
jgi:hypothetical protein